MHTTTATISKLFLTTVVVVSGVSYVLNHSDLAFAQTVEDGTAVTASVSDITPPSTPILISPTDDSKLKINSIPFVWQESTDNWLMDHYTLTVNDTILFDDIPLEAETNSGYTLAYDSGTGYYTLTRASTFGDGSYEWYITAWDYHGNSSTSVEWNFSIDTKAPDFAITQIEDQDVEITTTDADSVPDDAIVLEENEPSLSGTGEANSTVHLTITYPNGDETEVQFTIGSDGTWSITLEELQRDGTIYLDFLITDPTGNVSILDDVPIVLYTPVIEIPLPSLPPFIPAQPSTPEEAPPVIEIPVLPPLEYLPPVIRKLPRKVVYFVRSSTVTISESMVTWLDIVAALSVLLLMLSLPISKVSFLTIWYRYYVTAQLLKEFLWLIGLRPKKNPMGIVVSREDLTPIPFALVLISGKSESERNVQKTLITDIHGIFPVISLPDGEYRMSVHHPLYFFPSLNKTPAHLSWNSFYTGAPFKLKNGTLPPPLILPVELVEKQGNARLHKARTVFLSAPSLSFPLFGVGACLCLAFPSVPNFITLGVYFLLTIHKYVRSKGITSEIQATDSKKTPLPKVIVALKKENSPEATVLVQTDSHGVAHAKVTPGSYTVWAVDFQRRLMEGDRKSRTSFKVEKAKDYLPLVLERV